MATQVATYVVDACALIAYLRGETGGDKLRALLKKEDNKFLMHSVNLGEVYYDTLRIKGLVAATELFIDIARLPNRCSLDIGYSFH